MALSQYGNEDDAILTKQLAGRMHPLCVLDMRRGFMFNIMVNAAARNVRAPPNDFDAFPIFGSETRRRPRA
eukprot:2540281-Pleurochrysis_carterae.AAC.2